MVRAGRCLPECLHAAGRRDDGCDERDSSYAEVVAGGEYNDALNDHTGFALIATTPAPTSTYEQARW
jgi:hypothetical protein